MIRLAFIASLALLMASCAQRQPVLYPNGHLLDVGSAQAEEDIARCLDTAERYVDSGDLRDVAADTATGAVVGGAAGGAAGAVFGRAGRGAAAGAAGAAAGTLARSALRRGPDPVVRAYVVRCLRVLGYDPIGWR